MKYIFAALLIALFLPYASGLAIAPPNFSKGCYCTMEYDPVCSTGGVTYSNACSAKCSGAEIAYKGECRFLPKTCNLCPKIFN